MILSRGLGMHTLPIRIFNPGSWWSSGFIHGIRVSRYMVDLTVKMINDRM